MPFICIAPSPTSAIAGALRMRELRGDRVGHAGAHRGEFAGERRHHARGAASESRANQFAARPGVGADDRAVGKPRRQLPEEHAAG